VPGSAVWETLPPPELPERPEGAPPPRRPGSAAWRPWMAFVGLIAGFGVAIVGGVAVAIVGAAFGSTLEDVTPAETQVSTLVQDAALVGAAILLARSVGPVGARLFGLRGTAFWPAVGWAVLAYGAYVVFTGIWAQIVSLDEEQEVLDALGVDESVFALLSAAFIVCVLAPVVEEFFFRGFFYGSLRRLGVIPAALVSGAVFGGIHAGSSPVEALVPLAVLGVALCLLYEKTGSLYPCIVLHAINNCLAFGVSEDWTWQIPILLVASLAACAAVVLPVARLWRPTAAAA
jgi:uncharacterized protein